jgi:predicted esterase
MHGKTLDHPHGGSPVVRIGADPADASSAMILIHGRGASAESMVPLAESLTTDDADNMAVLIPQAAGSVWYPQRFIAPLEGNEPYLSSALAVVTSLLEELVSADIAPARIIIGGFSQGACLSAEFAARHPQRYGGILVFSGGVIGPPGTDFGGLYSGDLAGTPAFIGCSDTDFHIPLERVRETTAALTGLGANATERIYPGMGHTINADELAAAKEIVQRVAAGSDTGP